MTGRMSAQAEEFPTMSSGATITSVRDQHGE